MARIRVLIAEDDRVVLEALCDLINRDGGMELVGSGRDADEAIALARETRPQVAILDVRMPAGGGPRAAREILQVSPETRVMALSAYDDRESVFDMLRSGAVGYVVKGSSIEDILEAIRSTAAGRGSLSTEITVDVVKELAGHLERGARDADLLREQSSRIRRILSGHGLNVVFQPLVDLESGQGIAVEALARFGDDPNRSADIWFAEASAAGLRPDLELATLRYALSHLELLSPEVRMAVNVSPASITAPRFLEAFGDVAPERLILEVTDDRQTDDYRAINQALGALRARGAQISVDAVGQESSRLRHILRVAPDFIKLDSTLTRAVDREVGHQALVAALVSFATQVGAATVAMGVETRGELEALRRLRVSYAQGHQLAGPGPISGFDFSQPLTAPATDGARPVAVSDPGPTTRSFPELLAAARTLDEDALGDLFHRNVNSIYRYVFARLRDRAVVEEVTAETFLAMAREISSFVGEDSSSFSAWLLGIARTRMAERLPLMRRASGAVVKMDDSVAGDLDPQQAALFKAMDQLSEEQQEVLILKQLVDCDQETLSQLTGQDAEKIALTYREAVAALNHLIAQESSPNLPG